jgi:hypothetical protein
MSPTRAFCQIFALLTCLCSLSVTAASLTTDVRIRVVDDYMIVVPVTINGSGPYDLLLDTGSSLTMLDQKLADELALRRGGEITILRPRSSMIAAVVYAESLSIADATVAGKDLALLIDPAPRGLPRGVRGILGEDFLQRFDVLIDYEHRILRLESGLGSMAETLMGEHLPIQLNGSPAGERPFGRLLVTGQIREFGVNSLSLLLDSGTDTFVLFRKNLGFGLDKQVFVDLTAQKSFNHVSVETRTVRSLKLGKTLINDLVVVALPTFADPHIDGLMPTSRFRSIFISHQGRFVILNPSSSKSRRKP